MVGFYISEEPVDELDDDGNPTGRIVEKCPYLEDGWNYALFNKDKGFADIDSMIGAYGNDWKFKP